MTDLIDIAAWKSFLRARKTRKTYRRKSPTCFPNHACSPIERDRLLLVQRGLCGICGCATKLVVDHCHRTGKTRGLICTPCNVKLGSCLDSPKLIRMHLIAFPFSRWDRWALAYLARSDG